MKPAPGQISGTELSVICHFSIFSCLNTGSRELMFHDVLSLSPSLEWRKWWQQSQLQTVRRHTHFPLWAFMWLYIKHSWVLVRPGVFTQRWVLTLGTGCLSRTGASGAAQLIGASGRNSEEQTHCTGPLDISQRVLCSALRSQRQRCGQDFRQGRPKFLHHAYFSTAWHKSRTEMCVCERR